MGVFDYKCLKGISIQVHLTAQLPPNCTTSITTTPTAFNYSNISISTV
jgi:hypothetical protein